MVVASKTSVIQGLERINVTQLKGVGAKLAERLAKLDVYNLQDVLFHLPARYQDRTTIRPMGSLVPGTEVLVQGEILMAQVVFGRRRSLVVRVSDGTGSLTLRLFHFSRSQEQGFERGLSIRCFGEVRRGAQSLEMVHPEYSINNQEFDPPDEQYLSAVYPTIEGIGQRVWRSMVGQVLMQLNQAPSLLNECLPGEIVEQYGLTSLHDAITGLHQLAINTPADWRETARCRLAFEELMAHHLSLSRFRLKNRVQAAPVLAGDVKLETQFIQRLPFELTAAQQRVASEISGDLNQSHPMMRLVQGDVGSGKTVIAALAALKAVQAGCQVAIMAPTEILADQHRATFDAWFSPIGLAVVWLVGSQGAVARREALAAIASGAQIIVGTHALFQQAVEFSRLGLVIVDEQHRFGVHQRLALRDKGKANGLAPHQLVMTATPIPRTLAMTVYADLDVSVIDELPKGRKPIDTVVLPQSRRHELMARVFEATQEGRQVYWVCPLIEESDLLEAQAAEEAFAEYREAYPDLRVGLVHGRMKPVQKDEVMKRFKAGDLDLLVATTVIEVGVDVPNASLMVIENAERLGLSQLHQLRGRVGRGSQKSDCVLMYKGPLSGNGKERLAVMRDTQDGFQIAEKDLELRGPGELLGTRQTGMFAFRIADLKKDQALLETVDQAAKTLLEKYPDHVGPLVRRWVGHGIKYTNA